MRGRGFACCLVLAPLVSWAAAKEKLAILPGQADASLQSEAAALEELIAADVARSGRWEVLSSSDVSTVIGVERQRTLAGCNEGNECMQELAGALGADKLLVVSFGRLGGDRLLAIKVIDFAQAKVAKRQAEQIPEGGSVAQAAHRLTAFVLDLPPPPTPSKVPRAGWFVLGGAGVLALGGAGVGIAANGDAVKYRSDPYNDALANRATTKAGVADGLYAGAVVAAAVGAVMLVLSRGEP